MSNLFKRVILFIGLTVMISGAMPSATAYAIGNNFINAQAESDETVPPATSAAQCRTIDNTLSPDDLETLDDRGGEAIALKSNTERFDTFVHDFVELVGTPPPYVLDGILVVYPSEESSVANIAFYSEGCAKGMATLPRVIIEGLLKVPAAGEKVD